MPTYEYACPSCQASLEVQQRMTDPALTECPECGASGLRKLFSGVGIHFKGSGFYRTDSRDAKAGAAASGSDSGGSASKGDASSGSSETSSGSKTTGSTKESSGSSGSTPAKPAAASAPSSS